jgi:hypothetical protein
MRRIVKDTRKKMKFFSFTVKLSSSLFVGKLGLTLRTCEAVTSGTMLEDAAVSLPIYIAERIGIDHKRKGYRSSKKGLLPLFDAALILIGPQGVGVN